MFRHSPQQQKTSKRPVKRMMFLAFLTVLILASCTSRPLPELVQPSHEPMPEPETGNAESMLQSEATMAPLYREYSRDEAVQRLNKNWHYAEVTEENFGMSVLEGPKEVAELFLAAGLSADSKALNGIPVLCIAIMSKQYEIARLLMAEGADIHATDTNGNTPIALAVSQCGLLEKPKGLNPLVQALIDAGADISVTIMGGETIYETADTYKCTEILEMLRKAGAK